MSNPDSDTPPTPTPHRLARLFGYYNATSCTDESDEITIDHRNLGPHNRFFVLETQSDGDESSDDANEEGVTVIPETPYDDTDDNNVQDDDSHPEDHQNADNRNDMFADTDNDYDSVSTYCSFVEKNKAYGYGSNPDIFADDDDYDHEYSYNDDDYDADNEYSSDNDDNIQYEIQREENDDEPEDTYEAWAYKYNKI